MTLSEFILKNIDTILREWEEFAATLVPAAQKKDRVMLRDHGKKVLEAIAVDIARPQTAHEKDEKSKGHDPPVSVSETAAETHGADRLASGFSLNSAVAEFRALRASVIRLWQRAQDKNPVPSTAIEELIRFSEAIDQAIAESVTSYSFEKDQQTRVFDTILSSSPDFSFTFDLHGKFMFANKALREFFERPLQDIVGKTFLDLEMPAATELQQQILQVITTKQNFHGEMPYTTRSGQQIFYDYIFVPVFDNDDAVEAVAGSFRDITERKAAENENWYKANYDVVTGLPNRQLFLDRLEQDLKHAVRKGAPIALLFIDLDHFKAANDRFGHDVGDQLLRLAGERIRSCVRDTDTVARLGGDEFTVILQDLTHAAHAELVAGKLIVELSSPFQIGEDSIQIAASIGIAVSAYGLVALEDFIKNADMAMYAAKNSGRNRFCVFAPPPHTPVTRDLSRFGGVRR